MKKCTKCNIVYPVSEYYKWRNVCKKCCINDSKITTCCIDCGKERIVTKTSKRNSNGRCRSCAQKIERNKPEMKIIMSETARVQVLRQGGIPNANKFKSKPPCEHHNWKGGVTSDLDRIRCSAKYFEWRKSVIERDNYTCQVCNKKVNSPHAHHIKKFKNFPELRFDIDNGQTLCASCHTKHEPKS